MPPFRPHAPHALALGTAGRTRTAIADAAPAQGSRIGQLVGQMVGPMVGPVDGVDSAAAAREERRSQDAVLIASALRGDDDAFRRLVEKYQKPVYWVAYDVLLDAEEARDVAQETFLRVHAALPTFDPTRDFVNWLYRIARNLAIDAHRRRRRRAAPVEDLTGVPAGEGAEAGRVKDAHDEVRARVAEILERMPVEYRLALTLREFHGMNPREIAAVTDCSYPTARWRLHRARLLFKKLWEERYGMPAQEES